MDNDQQANMNPEGQQDAPMPSADQTAEAQGSAESAPQEVSSPQQAESGLPEGVKERTAREFDKLQEQLRMERERRMHAEQVFQSMQAPQIAPIYDPETGLLNEQAMSDVQRQALEATQRANRAEQSIQNYLKEQEEKEAFSAHPELQPGSKVFDKDLHIATRSLLLDSMLNPHDYGNKQLTFKEAGDMAKRLAKPSLERAKTEGAQEALEKLTPKEQAALSATSSPARRNEVSAQDYTTLRAKTRRGGEDGYKAIAERLKGTGWKG